MMSWPIDKVLQEMASNHIRIMDLTGESELEHGYHTSAHKYSPYIDEDEENKVHETMDREEEDEEVIRY
jgi:hypothetical protein